MPKVSVLMPNYNTKEEFLRESIESILNQTFSDFELIIVDDGSREEILPILCSYNDERIKYFKNEVNLGVAKTRNKLMSLANGEYIAWQDSDDISFPERLEKQVKFLDANKQYSIVGSNLVTFPNGKVTNCIPTPKLLDFLGGCVFSQGTSMIRKEDFINNNLFYDENLHISEDYDLWSRTVNKLNFYCIQEVLLKYRKNPNSLVHKKNNDSKIADNFIKTRILDLLTDDEQLQKKISVLLTKHYKKQTFLWEKIFSIRNEWYGINKYKVLTILGFKIKLYGV